jgi:holo-[acyl-carrier protein] synthase
VIVGIGSDLADIRRIQASLDRFGDRFVQRVFTDIERARSERKPDRAASYAKRFAAKEACSKALGTGLKRGVYLTDMGVVNLPSGRPTMALTRGAAARLAALIPPGMDGFIHVSLTDDHPYAQAFVVIEALPKTGADPAGSLARDGANV